MPKGSIEWHSIVAKMQGFSAAQAVWVAQDAAKRPILDSRIETLRELEEFISPEHLEAAIQEIRADRLTKDKRQSTIPV